MGIRTKLTNEIELILDIMRNNGTISKKQVYFILKNIMGKSEQFIETNISVIYTGKRIIEIEDDGIIYYNLNTPEKSQLINYESVLILWGILDTITYGDPEGITSEDRAAAIAALSTLREKKSPFTSSYIFKNVIYNTAFINTSQPATMIFIADEYQQKMKQYNGVDIYYHLVFKSAGDDADNKIIDRISKFELDKKLPHALQFVTQESDTANAIVRIIEVEPAEE